MGCCKHNRKKYKKMKFKENEIKAKERIKHKHLNDANNIFMSGYKGSNDNPVITVKSGEDVELPISFSHLMHKMDFNLTLANGYTSNDINSENIIVEISATSKSGDIAFIETRNINLRSNTISNNSTSTTIRAYGNKPHFSTMLFPMTLEREVVFTFSVYIDGEKRYCNGLRKALAYFVYAKMLRNDGNIIARAGAMQHQDQYAYHTNDGELKRYDDTMTIAEKYLGECLEYANRHNNKNRTARQTRCRIIAVGN